MTPPQTVLGIDISKAKCYVALLKDNRQPQRKVITNNSDGFEELSLWLTRQQVQQVHVCLEATNTYGQALAMYLHQQGHFVSIVNPARIQGFAQSQMSRTKNDQADAVTIARFCQALRPVAWTPLSAEIEQLQQLTRRLEALTQMITQEKNRLETASALLKPGIEAHIAFLRQQVSALKQQIQEHIQNHSTLQMQAECLTSIVGVAQHSAAHLLAEIGHFKQFRSARQLAAYAGLTPQEHLSGTSVHGRTRLCKVGNPRLRRILYFPALVALRHCPPRSSLG